MSIEKIIVSNFKILVNQTINFRGVTVLAGGNSVGKSTTIQIILLVRSLIEKIFSKNLAGESGRISIPLNGPYMLSLGSTKEVISWETGKKFSVEISGLGESLKFEFEADNLEETNYFIFVNFPKLQSSLLPLVIDNFYYLNAERLGPRIRHWVNENPSNINCGFRGEYTIEILAKIGEERQILNELKYCNRVKLPGAPTLSKYTEQWLDFIIPDTNVGNAEIFGNIRSASVKFNRFFTAPNVGFGVSYVLPIIVTALMAEDNSIILIENPEAHLHPKGQSRIGYFLGCMAGTGLQLVIETHSEHVVNGIRLAAVEQKNELKIDLLIDFFKQPDESYADRVTMLEMNEYGDLSDFPNAFFVQAQQDLLNIMKLGRQ